MTDRYAVAGNPVAHSRSPMIHAAFARQTGQDIEYRRLLVPAGGFAEAAARFFAGGGRGLNVTVPFKADAHAFASRLAPHAAKAGAVNTLALQPDGSVLGDNTDGIGLVRDLQSNLRWPVSGARVLMLGAGGAARGVLGPLLEAGPASLHIANRSPVRARELAARAAGRVPVEGGGPELAASGPFDLVINASSAGLAGEAPPLPAQAITGATYCYDMVYASGGTPFLALATERGATRCADGLGMLVEQAAESFYIWRGLRPDTREVLARLRSGFRIRAAAGPADMAQAARLFRDYQRWLDAELCFQGFEAELAALPGAYAPPGGALLFAESNGRPFGCVALRPLGEGTCEMKRLYVPEEWRGAGVGRALAAAAIAAAREAGHRAICLETLERLREANALYADLGFRRCPPPGPDPGAGAVCWRLELDATVAAT